MPDRSAKLMLRAERSLAEAQLLLDNGFLYGAASRAYYSMFDTARAVLDIYGFKKESQGKTHQGLIASLGLRLAKDGLLDKKYVSELSRAFELRQLADYIENDIVTLKLVKRSIESAYEFLAHCQSVQTKSQK